MARGGWGAGRGPETEQRVLMNESSSNDVLVVSGLFSRSPASAQVHLLPGGRAWVFTSVKWDLWEQEIRVSASPGVGALFTRTGFPAHRCGSLPFRK